jgi:hypothetical protein
VVEILKDTDSSSSSSSAGAAGQQEGTGSKGGPGARQQGGDQQQQGQGKRGDPRGDPLLTGGGSGRGPLPRSSSSMTGPGWDQLRSNFGQEGLDKLADLLRADSLRVSGLELSEMAVLSEALNRILQVGGSELYGLRFSAWGCHSNPATPTP